MNYSNSHLLHLFIISFLFVNNVLAYGYIGHEITAAIAQRFLTPKAREHVQELLPKEANGQLYFIAAWADRVKYRPEYRFTSRMHYISPPPRTPPNRCIVKYTPGRVDLLNAIHNYTNRLDPKSDLDFWPRAEALRFVVHYIGDLHQPLHVASKQRGGNGASAIFEGHKTNLHYIWDSRLINKHIRELGSLSDEEYFSEDITNNTSNFYGGPFYEPYVKHILNLVKTVWKQEIAEWIVCKEEKTIFEKENWQTHFGLLNSQNSSISCPEDWAISINKINCQVVWKDYKPNTELSEGIYYERIKQTRIVEKLLAVAGIRMAAVLNSLLG